MADRFLDYALKRRSAPLTVAALVLIGFSDPVSIAMFAIVATLIIW